MYSGLWQHKWRQDSPLVIFLVFSERREWKEKFLSMDSLVTCALFAKSPATSCKMTCSFHIWLSRKLWWWALFPALIYLGGRKWKKSLCIVHNFCLPGNATNRYLYLILLNESAWTLMMPWIPFQAHTSRGCLSFFSFIVFNLWPAL